MPSGIYRHFPLLEREWEGLQRSRRAPLDASLAWYTSRLAGEAGSVAELACGYGRLLLPIARAGVRVVGADAAPERVAAARELFAAQGIEDARFECCEMPAVPRGERFRAVILACNAIGYVLEERQKKELLSAIHDALLPAGRLLLDHDRGSALLRAVGRWPGLAGRMDQSGTRISTSLRWDRQDWCIVERFRVREEDGTQLEDEDRFRFTSATRTLELLRTSGFRVEECSGSFAGEAYRPWSRKLAIVARRR